MIHAVRCPSCANLSRVDADSLGQSVACPHCGRPFEAAPDPGYATRVRREPVVARFAPPRGPVVARLAEDQHSPDAGDLAHGPNPLLVALTLLPLGIPLLWLVGPLLTGHHPVFSFAAPVALALGLGGLTLGIGFAHGWTPGTRLRAVLMVILIGYFVGAFLFFLKKEWAEEVRRHIGPETKWDWFVPPHDKNAYKVKMPGHPQAAEGLLPGWELKGYRYTPDRKGRDAFAIVYEIADGKPPPAVVKPEAPDGDFFEKAKAAVCEGCKGEVVTEKEVTQQSHPGREYVLTLPDGATNRIVRVFRVKDRAYYLAVEGAFIPNDAKYVEMFFDTFYVQPK